MNQKPAATAARPTFLVVPTRHASAPLPAQAQLRDPLRVGSQGGAWSPSDVLRLVKSGRRPDLVIHSDQLVTAEDAPLPVDRAGVRTFLSSLEALLQCQHGYRALIWSRQRVVEAPDMETLLSLLASYLDDCAELPDWTARPQQCHRTREARAAAAQGEIRRLQDASLLAWVASGRPLDDCLRRILVRTDTALKQLRAA